MEDTRLMGRLAGLFEETLPVLRLARKGFTTDNKTLINESVTKFRGLLKARVKAAEELFKKEQKTEEELKVVSAIIPLQTAALAIENVIEKMAVKAEAQIPFTEKAFKEIDSLLIIVYAELMDVKDYLTTGNPHLKESIRKHMEDLRRLADEYDLVHQNRMITGVCVPKASYLYIDISDSLKRAARALMQFSEKV